MKIGFSALARVSPIDFLFPCDFLIHAIMQSCVAVDVVVPPKNTRRFAMYFITANYCIEMLNCRESSNRP